MQQRNGHYFYSRYATGIRFIKELRETNKQLVSFLQKNYGKVVKLNI